MPDINAAQLEREKLTHEHIVYDREEQEYFKFITQRIEDAKRVRDQPHPEFDSMTYMQFLEGNERMWNATIEPKTDPRDWRSRARRRTVFSRGNMILGRLMEENFMSEFYALDVDNVLDTETSRGLTDAVEATKHIERSPSLEFLIGMELLKHGNVFVRETFQELDRQDKDLANTTHTDPWQHTWKARGVQAFKRQATKQLIRPDSVYLGDLSLLRIEDQPYVCIRTKQNFEVARASLGKMPRWKKYVRPGITAHTGRMAQEDTTYLDHWRMGSLGKNEVEIVEYIDPWNNEYQVIVQGVMMYPVGYPIPWASGGYNLGMGGLYVINPHFAYRHGLAHVMRSDAETRDFFLRYMTDRSLQDLLKPMASNAKKTLTQSIFIPGRITHGVKPDDVQPWFNDQLPSSAVTMYEMFEKNLEEDSISKILTGQQPEGDPTAYQVSVQQRMATRALGSIVFNYIWLLQDLDFMRAQTILERMSEYKTSVDPLTKQVKKVYSSLMLEGAELGTGEVGNHLMRFAPTSDHPTSINIERQERDLTEQTSVPTKISYIDGDAIRDLHYTIYNEVKSSPRKNSDTRKILFDSFITSVRLNFPATTNIDYLQSEFAKVWEKDPEKLFLPSEGVNPNTLVPAPVQGGGTAQQLQAVNTAGRLTPVD